MSEEGVAAWGGRSIEFSVVRSERKTMSITVNPLGEVVVRVPDVANIEEVTERVAKRGGWISYHQRNAERWRPRTPARTYEVGETHLFLGRQYRLSAEIGLAQSVKTLGDRIVLTMHRPNRIEERKSLLDGWYLTQAREIFGNRLDKVFQPFAALNHARPRLIVRNLTHRWGSLTSRGNLVISRHIVRAPRQCIDYVLVHELCHLEYRNHGAEFWALLDRMMPDHQKRKARLEKILL
ncbi:M48 family metallopeptidase [Blastomonas fulva]|uniref:M48 family metallopeptidase n=1 Tax=Blastomonas fulva TaxID=1550728 RepID=UPI00336A180E